MLHDAPAPNIVSETSPHSPAALEEVCRTKPRLNSWLKLSKCRWHSFKQEGTVVLPCSMASALSPVKLQRQFRHPNASQNMCPQGSTASASPRRKSSAHKGKQQPSIARATCERCGGTPFAGTPFCLSRLLRRPSMAIRFRRASG